MCENNVDGIAIQETHASLEEDFVKQGKISEYYIIGRLTVMHMEPQNMFVMLLRMQTLRLQAVKVKYL